MAKQKKQFRQLSDEELEQVSGGVTAKTEELLARIAEVTGAEVTGAEVTGVSSSFSGTILD